MPLETITRRSFAQRDRADVQERVVQQVERDPERFLALYAADPRSFGERYVNSDLMKEMFAEYRESREARNRYNAPVHNAAAAIPATINHAAAIQSGMSMAGTGTKTESFQRPPESIRFCGAGEYLALHMSSNRIVRYWDLVCR